MTDIPNRCENCAHSSPRKARTTHLEAWEQDARPERPKGLIGALKEFINPKQFRNPHPYGKKERLCASVFEFRDACEIVARKTQVICTLMPKHVEVHREHYCGQFQEIPVRG